ncbi:Ger(x)C family spore germination C-terminal domain-containing protein [Brevibacillus sp. AG]|uniref:Ger(x)C family spore germination C-terminal domain-containing protein n=1 Tax=Brevibacillus sp. AG TaxID=3020891 RepID=UPI000853D61C|nr:Ger(x)C family spore germination C-terminal domain-containing protein [Brevibacillus sp. AG]MDC0759319.1 Ger(x)C family spore germination C-terminal domain-containing protein [Brevibacillus sp. AG]
MKNRSEQDIRYMGGCLFVVSKGGARDSCGDETKNGRRHYQAPEKQVDPIGLGKYARAYAYDEWKKVEDEWGRAFSKAKVTIHPEVKIISVGALKK